MRYYHNDDDDVEDTYIFIIFEVCDTLLNNKFYNYNS